LRHVLIDLLGQLLKQQIGIAATKPHLLTPIGISAI
jgi:hypothetical protein